MAETKKIRNVFEFLLLQTMAAAVRLLPYRLGMGLARLLSFLVFYVLRIRRAVTIENLCRAFPEKSPAECQHLAWRVYRHFGRVAVDFIFLPRLIPRKFFRLVTVKNESVLKQAFEKGQGVVLNGPHLGNWEFMAAVAPLLGYPTRIIVGTQRNNLADRWINRTRLLAGSKIIHVGGAVRKSLEALSRGEVVALLSDQDAGRDGLFVPFFGRKASASVGAALLALKGNAPMVYAQTVWQNGQYVTEFVEIKTDDLHGPTPENLYELTRRFTEWAEKQIRHFPEQWFWMHRRWKTRPSEEMP